MILSYDSDSAEGHPELWPGLPYWWANQRTADGVIHYLESRKAQGRPGRVVFTPSPCCFSLCGLLFLGDKVVLLSSAGFFVCGLNLTADRHYILDKWNMSLRKLTFSNWQDLRAWLEEQTPGSGRQCLNIVAGDFVGSLPLCSLVIALNQKHTLHNRKK